jgi:hypothetical protein
MDLLRILNSQSFMQWLAESLVLIFLLGGLAVLAVGLGLIFNSAGTLRLFESMNRWVSMRRTTKPIEINRDTRQFVQRYRRVVAAAFIVGGLFALYGLTMRFDERAAAAVLGLGIYKPAFSGWVVDSARWVLILGNLSAIVIGLALAFSPAAVEKLEAAGSRWFSERQMSKGATAPHNPLDQKVAANPRASGLLMAFFGLVLVCAFGLMLLGTR